MRGIRPQNTSTAGSSLELSWVVGQFEIYRAKIKRPAGKLAGHRNGTIRQMAWLAAGVLRDANVAETIVAGSYFPLPRRNIPSGRASIVVVVNAMGCGLLHLVDGMKRIHW
jgi:hypothetical protein